MKEKVGLIGAGIMGKLMVDHMVAGGYDVYVSDPDSYSQEYCKKAGATVLENNVELAKTVNRIIGNSRRRQCRSNKGNGTDFAYICKKGRACRRHRRKQQAKAPQ